MKLNRRTQPEVLRYFPNVTRETLASVRYERLARMQRERARERQRLTIVCIGALMAILFAGKVVVG